MNTVIEIKARKGQFVAYQGGIAWAGKVSGLRDLLKSWTSEEVNLPKDLRMTLGEFVGILRMVAQRDVPIASLPRC